MRGSAASHTDENLRRFVPTINCRRNKILLPTKRANNPQDNIFTASYAFLSVRFCYPLPDQPIAGAGHAEIVLIAGEL
jgi:hypothetical protein